MNIFCKIIFFPLYFIAVVVFIAPFGASQSVDKSYGYINCMVDALAQWWED